jgi:lysophospholipase L1-like esterase
MQSGHEPRPAVEPRAGGSRTAELVLIILFLMLIASGLPIQTAIELRRGEALSALHVFRQKPTAVNLRTYEHNLEEASVVARVLRPLFQSVQFAWLRDGGEKALVGRDGWLFYKPGFDDLVSRGNRAAATNDPVAAIVAFRDALAARGIHLLVLPTPNKESIYPDLLTRRAPAGQIVVSPVTRNLLARLRSAGVEYVDLFGVFAAARANTPASGNARLYLQQDSHWSPAGVELAARTVARRLIELGWAKPGRHTFSESPAPANRVGDILRMLQSARIEAASVPEPVPCVQVMQEDASPYRDGSASEVLVLGDSFLRIYQQDEPGSAGFVAHLAKELKQPLTSLVSDGGASTLVRQELHRRPGLLKHKRVVVWEFVERDIRLGTEGWQQVPLPGEVSDSRLAPMTTEQ